MNDAEITLIRYRMDRSKKERGFYTTPFLIDVKRGTMVITFDLVETMWKIGWRALRRQLAKYFKQLKVN